jgi:hypothetical protein
MAASVKKVFVTKWVRKRGMNGFEFHNSFLVVKAKVSPTIHSPWLSLLHQTVLSSTHRKFHGMNYSSVILRPLCKYASCMVTVLFFSDLIIF